MAGRGALVRVRETISGSNVNGIDPESPIPLYYQLKTLILEDIANGTYTPGDRLPTEHQLCDHHGISRTPAHRALAELAAEGVILRTRGRGTFVNPHWVPRRDGTPELRIEVTDPQWAAHIEANAPSDLGVSVATIEYAEMRHALMSGVAEGRAPDIALIDEVWIGDLAAAGFLLPLDEIDNEWIRTVYKADFVKAFVEGQRFDGHVYAVPEEINVAGVWYRREYLDELGVEAPETWEELAQLTRKIQPGLPAGTHAIAMPGGHVAGETTCYCLLAVLASNGVSILNGAVNVDTVAGVEAMRFLRSFVDQGAMTTDVVTYKWLRCPNLLGSGRAAITLGGSYEAEVIAEAAGIPLDEVPERFVFTPFPAGPRGEPATVAGGMAYAVLRQSKDPEKAMKLIEHIVETDALADRAQGRPNLPPRNSAIELIAAESPFVAKASALFSTAVIRPVIADYHLVSVQLQNMLENVLTGRHGPAAAVERTAEIISAITGLPINRD
jgi:ABC-type glycerol-3-phosphate transport system substrate-binding protein/DNA-binding transcriptional regulator YhcF (GntR family)